jgi:ubiquinone/menaquinone biosynthesis C-methylase UbiE
MQAPAGEQWLQTPRTNRYKNTGVAIDVTRREAIDFDMAEVLVESILHLVREMAASVPSPRGAPYYALDDPAGDFEPLSALCSRGIFRKYEQALHLGAGLGGPARWWSLRFGCDVLGVECVAPLAWAAGHLTSRAQLGSQVRFIAAELEQLPLRGKVFTHVWGGDALHALPEPVVALREARRVLRPGAQLALRLNPARATDSSRATPEYWRECVAEAEFVETTLQAGAPPRASQSSQLAHQGLVRFLSDADGSVRRKLIDYLRSQGEEHSEGPPRILLFARRAA